MSTDLVSVIIATAGAKDYIFPCLASIRKQTYQEIETIVVDNSLGVVLRARVAVLYPEAKIYSSPVNLFYSQAVNKGIEMSRGKFILCLNDDAVLDEEFIKEALRGFKIDAKIGMVSGKIMRPDRQVLDSAGLFLSVWRTAKERGYGLPDRGQFESPGYIFGVTGAAAFYRKQMLEEAKIGAEYLDADFRFFYEDLDIAWRAHKLGWKGYYINSALAYHVRGGTARQEKGVNKRGARCYINDGLLFDLVKNRYLAIVKNESILSFLLHLPFIALYDVFAWGYVLFFRFPVAKRLLSGNFPLQAAFRKRAMLRKMLNSM